MLRLITDEDFPGPIVRGLRHRQPDLDIVRVQEVGLRTKGDDIVHDGAALEGRILITRDRQTMISAAQRRVDAGQPMPGLIVVRENLRAGIFPYSGFRLDR